MVLRLDALRELICLVVHSACIAVLTA